MPLSVRASLDHTSFRHSHFDRGGEQRRHRRTGGRTRTGFSSENCRGDAKGESLGDARVSRSGGTQVSRDSTTAAAAANTTEGERDDAAAQRGSPGQGHHLLDVDQGLHGGEETRRVVGVDREPGDGLGSGGGHDAR